MTTTLKGIVRQMLALDQSLGRSEAIASLTTTTVVVTALATGGSKQRWIDRWLARFDTATTADRIRKITDATTSTGTLTHAGTNYVDTTATGEVVDILEYEPYRYLNAVNVTLAKLKHLDRTELPTVQNQRQVWLGSCSWILEPSDVLRIAWSDDPVLTRNRDFQKWNSYNTSGVLAPDSWTLTGASATMARSSTQTWRGMPYSLAITRAGTDCYISQAPGLLDNGVSADNLVGESVTAAFRVWSSTASQVRVSIYDGVTTTNGSFHTGGSGWEELTATATIGSTATTVEARLNVITSNNVVYVGEGYALETASLTDDVRRDNYTESDIDRTEFVDQSTSALATVLPMRSRKGTWAIYSKRGYPQLDSTRFAAGTADADIIDADAVKVATGAIAALYESLIDPRDEKSGPMYGPMAALWHQRFGSLTAAHQSTGKEPLPGGAMAGVLKALAPSARGW